MRLRYAAAVQQGALRLRYAAAVQQGALRLRYAAAVQHGALRLRYAAAAIGLAGTRNATVAMNATVLVVGILIVALAAVMISIDMALLRDLAGTPDDELAMLTRAGWMAAIIFTFPIGPILYVRYGKLR